MAVDATDTDLPKEISDDINVNIHNELGKEEVAEVVYNADRPYLEAAHVEERVNGKYTRDTVLERLEELVDAGILDADKTGSSHQYWIAEEESRWPVPSDVEVISDDDPNAITVQDLLNDEYASKGIVGGGLIIIGGAGTSGGVVISALLENIGPVYSAGIIIAALMLLVILIGFGLLLVSILLALWDDDPNIISKIIPQSLEIRE